MIEIRKNKDRGRTELGWLRSYHSFSFNRYYDPEHISYGPLRVLNDDFVLPGAGFPSHPHDNMEIVTYVLAGGLEHRDSMGTHSVIRANEVQRMTAGTGIIHSEFNASDTDPVRLLQIWFVPDKTGYAPSYEQKTYPMDMRRNVLLRVASNNNGGAVHVNQDVTMLISRLEEGKSLSHALSPGRGAYLYLIEGNLAVGGKELASGDAAMISRDDSVQMRGESESELVIFDVPLE